MPRARENSNSNSNNHHDNDDNSREASVVLVGGAVLDLQAAPARGDSGGNAQPLALGTSNPGTIRFTHGGLHVAVADVTTVQRFVTAEWIQKFSGVISSARVVVLDANLSKEALKAACDVAAKASVPVWFEPVSCTKSLRGLDILAKVSYISPNEEELRAMADAISPSRGDTTYTDDIDTLLGTGVKTVVLTLGSKGALVANTRVTVALSAPNIDHVVNVNGAGDSLVAGAAFMLSRGCDVKEAIAFGMAVAKRTVESEENAPNKVDFASLEADAERILATARVVRVRQHAKL
eukprot:jgi/Chlat1/1701/Chrsp127S00095